MCEENIDLLYSLEDMTTGMFLFSEIASDMYGVDYNIREALFDGGKIELANKCCDWAVAINKACQPLLNDYFNEWDSLPSVWHYDVLANDLCLTIVNEAIDGNIFDTEQVAAQALQLTKEWLNIEI